MKWWNGLTTRIESNAPLAELTWYKLGGPARWMVSPSSVDDLREVVRRTAARGVEMRVLGGGANVLIRDDGFDGTVIRLDAPAFTRMQFDGEQVYAGAGVDLMTLARRCSQRGLSGMERMAGIPGTVGGAVRMNAGGRYGQFGSVVQRVFVVGACGKLDQIDREELQFGYRSSDIGRRIVVGAVLRLTHADADETVARFKSIWAEKKKTQPLAARTAGCVFKNPPGEAAGALIDRAGLKGTRRGGAVVSMRHANFIETESSARSADVIALIDHLRETVSRRCGIEMELEIDVW